MPRRVATLFFDMNSYFASVCQAEEPILMGRPVGVVTAKAEGAMLIAASREAKRQGVGMGVRLAEAKRRCPDLVVRVAQHDVFVAYHHRIRAAVETILPIERSHSVDEFSCHLTGSQQDLARALAIGADLQRAIQEQVHPALTCSVGVAPNKLLAKIAAELKKPEGLGWLTPDVLPGKIAHLNLDDLPGISRGILPRLERAGIRTITQLYALEPKAARHLWGNIEGERFVRQLHGETVVLPTSERHSLGHGQRLTPQNRSPEGARAVARRLLVKAASRLRREGGFARALSLHVKCSVHGAQCHRTEMPPTQDTFTLSQLFDHHWRALSVVAPVSVSVTLGGLEEAADQIGDLFEARAPGEPTDRERLCTAIDGLNARFGQDSVQFGTLPPHKVPYTGAKIAFGRIPDEAEFTE